MDNNKIPPMSNCPKCESSKITVHVLAPPKGNTRYRCGWCGVTFTGHKRGRPVKNKS